MGLKMASDCGVENAERALSKHVVKGYPNECNYTEKLIKKFKEACILKGMQEESILSKKWKQQFVNQKSNEVKG